MNTTANPITRFLVLTAQGLGLIGAMAAIWWLVTNLPIVGLLGSWLAFGMLALYYTGHLKEAP